jgi:hypothetical protein
VAGEELLGNSKRAWAKLDYTPEDRPVVFQICSNSGYYMRRKRDGYIDVHRGCSTRKVSGRGMDAGKFPFYESIIGKPMVKCFQEMK